MQLTSAGHAALDGECELLCDLLLQVAGRDTNRLPSVRRHVAVLEAAMPHMTQAQSDVARARIRAFEDKWGPVLAGTAKNSLHSAENQQISPERRVAKWLSVRRNPERYLTILHRAATAVWSGETALGKIMDFAFANEVDRAIQVVGYDSFTEWMFQLRIAERLKGAVYQPGELCRWWVEDMEPTKDKASSYAACLRELVSILESRRNWPG